MNSGDLLVKKVNHGCCCRSKATTDFLTLAKIFRSKHHIFVWYRGIHILLHTLLYSFQLDLLKAKLILYAYYFFFENRKYSTYISAIPISKVHVVSPKLVNNMSSGVPVPSLGHLFPTLE